MPHVHDDGDRPATFAFGCMSLFMAACAAVGFAVAWYIARKEEGICTSSMHTLLLVMSYASLVAFVLHMSTALISFLGLIGPRMFRCAMGCQATMGLSILIASSLLSIVYFIWGIVVLSRNECRNTNHWVFTIVIVVLAGLSFLSGLTLRR